MKNARIVSMMLAVSLFCSGALGALTSWTIGFEDGTFGGLLGYGGAPASDQWQLSVADPQGNPHSGLYYAKPTTGDGVRSALITKNSSLSFGSGQGTLTAYFRFNYHTLDSAAILQVFGDTNQAVYLKYDRNTAKVTYAGDGTSTGAWRWRDDFIGDDAWGKAEIVVGDSGTSLYLDGVLMGSNPALTAINAEGARMGYNPWTTPSTHNQVFLDDISWVEIPEPATMGLLGVGSVAMLVRRRKYRK